MPAQRACFLELQSVIGTVFFLVAKIRQIHRLIPKQLSILLKTSYPSCVGKLPFSITVFHRTNDLDGFLPCHPVSCIQHLFVAKTTYSLIKLRTTSRAGISMNRNLALKILENRKPTTVHSLKVRRSILISACIVDVFLDHHRTRMLPVLLKMTCYYFFTTF